MSALTRKRLKTTLADSKGRNEELRDGVTTVPGGKNRKMQQVGRTSAGFKGGVSFAGRSTLVRAGTGRRQLKRRLSLRRRRGHGMNPKEKKVNLG